MQNTPRSYVSKSRESESTFCMQASFLGTLTQWFWNHMSVLSFHHPNGHLLKKKNNTYFIRNFLFNWLGRICVIEHPAPGTDKVRGAASIWNLKVIKLLKRFPAIKELSVYQGYYGAVSPKPTHFAVSNSPTAQKLLDECKITEILPPPLEMGKAADGSAFNTSQLKEYPEALPKGLASIALHWLRTHCAGQDVQHSATLDPEYQDLISPFRVDLIGLFGRGADTRGHGGNL